MSRWDVSSFKGNPLTRGSLLICEELFHQRKLFASHQTDIFALRMRRKAEVCLSGSWFYHLLLQTYFDLQQCTSTKISKNKKKKMKKKLKKQIEKQQQQQDEIEQGMLEENEEALDKDADECCSNNTGNCEDNSKVCEQNANELETNPSPEKTVENHVDSESGEFSEELSSQTLQEKCVVSGDDMSVTEEQNEPGKGSTYKISLHCSVSRKHRKGRETKKKTRKSGFLPVTLLPSSFYLPVPIPHLTANTQVIINY